MNYVSLMKAAGKTLVTELFLILLILAILNLLADDGANCKKQCFCSEAFKGGTKCDFLIFTHFIGN